MYSIRNTQNFKQTIIDDNVAPFDLHFLQLFKPQQKEKSRIQFINNLAVCAVHRFLIIVDGSGNESPKWAVNAIGRIDVTNKIQMRLKFIARRQALNNWALAHSAFRPARKATGHSILWCFPKVKIGKFARKHFQGKKQKKATRNVLEIKLVLVGWLFTNKKKQLQNCHYF